MKHLGQKSLLPTQYDPSLLEAVPRSVSSTAMGYDVWHAYEVSVLYSTGNRVCGILKFTYDAKSDKVVESKSLKLYLYSLSLKRFAGETPRDALAGYEWVFARDLAALLGTPVWCHFFTEYTTTQEVMSGFELLENAKPIPLYARPQDGALRHVKVFTHRIQTFCPITGQPDYGTLYLEMKGKNTADSIVYIQDQINAMCGQEAFHEDVVNRVYEHFRKTFDADMIMVACLYTRRGGIDICPVRFNHVSLAPTLLIDPYVLPMTTFRR